MLQMDKPKTEIEKQLNNLKDKVTNPSVKQSIEEKLKYVNKPIRK